VKAAVLCAVGQGSPVGVTVLNCLWLLDSLVQLEEHFLVLG
jgi:hypothetical protein